MSRSVRRCARIVILLAVCCLLLLPGLMARTAAHAAGDRASVGALGLKWPDGITVDGAGNVYVADYDAHHVLKLSSRGKLLATWGTKGLGIGQFLSPSYIAIGPHGRVFISDEMANRVEIFTTSGRFKAIWPCPYAGADKSFPCDGYVGGPFFIHPNGITVDGTGEVYVADYGNRRVERFKANGAMDGIVAAMYPGETDRPQTVALDPNGNLFVLVFPSGYVYVIDPVSAQLLHKKQLREEGANGAIAIDRQGTVYIADGRSCSVRRISPSGRQTAEWGSYGSGRGNFNNPHGIAVDATGNIYVSDTGNHRIVKLSPQGQVLAIWR